MLHTQSAGQASLRVVENNDFKQLPHLTLALRPGSDAALKQFLAFRHALLTAEQAQLKDFEADTANFFEGCLPLSYRGRDKENRNKK